MLGASPCNKRLLRDGDNIIIYKNEVEIYQGIFRIDEHQSSEIMDDPDITIVPVGKTIVDISRRTESKQPEGVSRINSSSEEQKFWDKLFKYQQIGFDGDRSRTLKKLKVAYKELEELSSTEDTKEALAEVSRMDDVRIRDSEFNYLFDKYVNEDIVGASKTMDRMYIMASRNIGYAKRLPDARKEHIRNARKRIQAKTQLTSPVQN